MSSTLEQLTAQALTLPPEQRAALAETLLESIDPAPPLSPEWEAEIARRVADTDAGRTRFTPADEAMAELAAYIHSRQSHRSAA
ncbi:MAG: addiction module protein [Burkholderiaceae bacterium]|nr:addiction module protein [Burkholderiaceae bacterium]